MTTKRSLIKKLTPVIPCPCCPGQMEKEPNSLDTYYCSRCGSRVWADPIGEGLVRYNVISRAW